MTTWIKNATLYRLSDEFTRDPEAIAEALAEQAFRPRGSLEPYSQGWAPPAGRDALVRHVNGATLICLRREDALLPPDVIREEVAERIEAIESAESRQVRAKERRRIADEVTFELLPRAFSRRRDMLAIIDHQSGWLIVDTASQPRAEALLVLLGHSLPHDPVDPWEADVSPTQTMTRWAEGRDQLPAGFALGDEVEMRDPGDDGARVACRGQDIVSDEVAGHLRARKFVTRIALEYEGRVSFTLDAALTLRKVRFLAVEEVDEQDDADEVARFDANAAFMVGELRRPLAALDGLFCHQRRLPLDAARKASDSLQRQADADGVTMTITDDKGNEIARWEPGGKAPDALYVREAMFDGKGRSS